MGSATHIYFFRRETFFYGEAIYNFGNKYLLERLHHPSLWSTILFKNLGLLISRKHSDSDGAKILIKRRNPYLTEQYLVSCTSYHKHISKSYRAAATRDFFTRYCFFFRYGCFSRSIAWFIGLDLFSVKAEVGSFCTTLR